MGKDVYVPHTFLLQMCITYLIYMFVTIIKVKMDAFKHFKNASIVLIAVSI